MSITEKVLEGTLNPDGTLILDEAPKLPPGRVKVLLQGIDIKNPQILGDEFFQMMEEIWSAQRSRGHVSRSVEEVESESQKLKAQMASEIDATIHLQEECRERRKQVDGENTAP
jgi:hypothetical protein